MKIATRIWTTTRAFHKRYVETNIKFRFELPRTLKTVDDFFIARTGRIYVLFGAAILVSIGNFFLKIQMDIEITIG